MKTDKQFYKLFSESPDYFFDLTGIHSSGSYTLRSETVKEFSRSMDGLMKPDNSNDPHFVVEFQMQKDKDIYYRIIMEMAALGINDQQNIYYGIIIFADKSVDTHSEPWSSIFKKSLPGFQIFYLDELLESLKKRNPEHPLLAVFQPYLQKDKEKLEKEASTYYNKIQKAAISDNRKKSLSNIFVSWLLIRFENKTYQEVLKMLTLTTPLEETRAYKELVAIGEKKGREEGKEEGVQGFQRLLSKLFSFKLQLSHKYLMKLFKTLSLEQMEELESKIFKINNIEELKIWIQNQNTTE
ncbi:MAG: DUF2887 domain-containing protein [Desulfosarcina sp.]|nr:DUF2887 domain-containing protein [Desulfobacterales bacterium]